MIRPLQTPPGSPIGSPTRPSIGSPIGSPIRPPKRPKLFADVSCWAPKANCVNPQEVTRELNTYFKANEELSQLSDDERKLISEFVPRSDIEGLMNSCDDDSLGRVVQQALTFYKLAMCLCKDAIKTIPGHDSIDCLLIQKILLNHGISDLSTSQVLSNRIANEVIDSKPIAKKLLLRVIEAGFFMPSFKGDAQVKEKKFKIFFTSKIEAVKQHISYTNSLRIYKQRIES